MFTLSVLGFPNEIALDRYHGRDEDDRNDERYDKRRREKSIFSEFFD